MAPIRFRRRGQVARASTALALAALLSAGFLTVASPSSAETADIQIVCQPSHVAVAVLRGYGLVPVDAWVSDQGVPVEVWSDEREGRALTLLLQDDAGNLLRCLLLPKTPPGEKS